MFCEIHDVRFNDFLLDLTDLSPVSGFGKMVYRFRHATDKIVLAKQINFQSSSFWYKSLFMVDNDARTCRKGQGVSGLLCVKHHIIKTLNVIKLT